MLEQPDIKEHCEKKKKRKALQEWGREVWSCHVRNMLVGNAQRNYF